MIIFYRILKHIIRSILTVKLLVIFPWNVITLILDN